jgi:hypothetical protein
MYRSQGRAILWSATTTALVLLGSLLPISLVRVYGQDGASIRAADQRLRDTIRSAMLTAAKSAGVAIDGATLVYASHEGVLIANTGITGFAKQTPANLEKGANLMFVYVSFPKGAVVLEPIKRRLASGFYTIKVTAEKGLAKATADLLDTKGRSVAVVPVLISVPPSGEGEPVETVSARIAGDGGGKWCLHFDIHGMVDGARVDIDGTVCA